MYNIYCLYFLEKHPYIGLFIQLCDEYAAGSVQCGGLGSQGCAGSAQDTHDAGYCYASTLWSSYHSDGTYRDLGHGSGNTWMETKTTAGFAASVRCLSDA